ncbi:unnamed protein product [Fusarium equiseti]|uniref:TauD/TfdA-like domain-containing protein n=1 Tax=Fusarium equiseti TaxID=61235 RepID=A0A8J2IPT8_FUSEQ|nr:unnamed protein product [Fusarium equiseti]
MLFSSTARLLRPFASNPSPLLARGLATLASQHILQVLEAPNLSYAQQRDHADRVSSQLERTGMLKISLGFPDNSSSYLKQLLVSLHEHHHHRLPISHSAKRGWFWDVRPNETTFQAGSHQARSETMNEFPWHTDCSYEQELPRYFALQVLQHDRYGGGTLSVMNVEKLNELLSPESKAALMAPEFRIDIPPEFYKDSRKHITGSILMSNGQSTMIRFREDIVMPLTSRAKFALQELRTALMQQEVQAHTTVHLKSSDLPKGSIILMDNRRWLHARNNIKDPERHLRRVRWDARAFDRSI